MMPDLNDPSGLAQAALGVVTAACLRKAGEAADAAVDAVAEQGRRLWTWLKDKLAGTSAEDVLDEYCQAPAEHEDHAGFLLAQLRKRIESDPEFADALRGMLPPAEQMDRAGVSQYVGKAINSQVTQIDGDGNQVNVNR